MGNEKNKRITENFYKNLDIILKVYDEQFKIQNELHDYGYTFNLMIQDNYNIEYGDEWNRLIGHLLEDGHFINPHWLGTGEKYLDITNKGRLFWENGKGGYVNKMEAPRIESQRRADLEQSIIDISRIVEANQNSQKWTNIITLIVAGIAAIATVGQWLKPTSTQVQHQKEEKTSCTKNPQLNPYNQPKNHSVLSNKVGETIKE